MLATFLIASTVNSRSQEPTPPTPAKLDGHTLFVERGCAHCHGPDAAGTQDAPNLQGVTQRLKPEEVRSQIVNGGKSMPAFGDMLTAEETDTLLVWLRSLKAAPKAKASSHHRGP